MERTLKPLNASPQGSFWHPCKEDFSANVTNLTPKEADSFQIVGLYRQRADAENVFDELKNQWGFSGFCSQKAAVSQSSARYHQSVPPLPATQKSPACASCKQTTHCEKMALHRGDGFLLI